MNSFPHQVVVEGPEEQPLWKIHVTNHDSAEEKKSAINSRLWTVVCGSFRRRLSGGAGRMLGLKWGGVYFNGGEPLECF